MSDTPDLPRHAYRDAPVYGWPFYIARRALRRTGRAMLAAADALSLVEKYTLASHFRPLLPANAALRDRHRGRRCFVIANGPSLAGQDLSPLAGEVTLAMNGFLRHPLLDVVSPSYYLFADGAFFDGSPASERFLADVRHRVTASTFLAPYPAARAIAGHGWLDPARTHFVAFGGNLRSAHLRGVDLTRTVPSVMNCAQLAILAALYMGCGPIYLLGTDHDWLAHRGADAHFYGGQTIESHAAAHGDLARFRYLDQMRDATDAWLGYEALGTYAYRVGVPIVNCTAGGFLDVFPRASYESVVGRVTARSSPPAPLRGRRGSAAA